MKNRWIDNLPNNPETDKLKKLVGPNQLGKIMAPITNSEPPLLSEDHFHQLANKYGNFYGNIDRSGSQKRPQESKDLFKLTLQSMQQLPPLREGNAKFKGIKYQNPPALQGTSGTAMGLFKSQDNTTYLAPDIPHGTDIVPLIDHETQHAIEHHYPKVQNTTYNFLKNRFFDPETSTSKVPADYIPNLYRSLQDVINFPAEFTGPYNAHDIREDKEKGIKAKKSLLETAQHQENTLPYEITENSLLHHRTLPFRLTNRFEEVPAFSVQAMSNPNHPWNIENANRDSTVLMHDILKDTRDQYKVLGLDDKDEEDKYKYEKARNQFDNLINQFAQREKEFSDNDHRPHKYRITEDGPVPVPRRTDAESYYSKGGRVHRSVGVSKLQKLLLELREMMA